MAQGNPQAAIPNPNPEQQLNVIIPEDNPIITELKTITHELSVNSSAYVKWVIIDIRGKKWVVLKSLTIWHHNENISLTQPAFKTI